MQHNNVDQCRDVNCRNRILKILPQGVVFQKTQKLLTKFRGLQTSDRYNYTIIIRNRRTFTTKQTLYGMSSFHFYR